MKQIPVLIIILICFYNAYGSVIRWDGGGDGISWNDPANWAGNVSPGTGDEVVLDNSFVVAGYSVRLPDTAVSVTKLEITPGASYTIRLLLPSTNTVVAAAFTTTGAGYSVILNNGGIFENNGTVSSGTNLSIADSLRINNGGRYIHKTRSGYASWIARLARCPGTEAGNFELDVPFASFLLSLSGRVYGNLILSAVASGGTITYSGSGASPLLVNGNLFINEGASFTISMSADFIIKGNLFQAANSFFNLQTAGNNNVIRVRGHLNCAGTITESGSGFPVLELNGSVIQQINISGSLQNQVTLKLNNPAGVTLMNDLVSTYHIEFAMGKLATSLSALLVIPNGATSSGASSLSFAEGPVQKAGDDDFIFPIGKGGVFAPLGIINASGHSVTDTFQAEYIRSNPQSDYGPATGPGLDHTSFVEYWLLEKKSGNASKRISLDVHLSSFCYVLDSTFVARWDGSMWLNEGATNPGATSSPPYELGTITSVNDVNDFSEQAFTLATNLPFPANPLPLDSSRVLRYSGIPATDQARIYPNPFSGEALLVFTARYPATALLSIYSMNGELVRRWMQPLHRGLNKIPLQLQAPAGFYLVEWKTPDQHGRIVIIKE